VGIVMRQLDGRGFHPARWGSRAAQGGAGWAVTSIALYGMLAFLRPESCDRTKD
jgi:hypothetical protein